jgi:SAM-dependent methyltransferase
MPSRVPERLTWAVRKLAPRSSDQLLEIGCGTGVLASLLCERLSSGQLTAIDRSPAMVAAARRRNRTCIAAGKAVIRRVALADADWSPATFHRAVAVNVNVFWLAPARELEVLKRVIRPDGILCVVYQPPSAGQIERVADATSAFLQTHGFEDLRVDVEELGATTGVCITAVPCGPAEVP